MILNAGIEVDTASDGSTFTVDLGTGVDADVFVDGFDATSAAAVFLRTLQLISQLWLLQMTTLT